MFSVDIWATGHAQLSSPPFEVSACKTGLSWQGLRFPSCSKIINICDARLACLWSATNAIVCAATCIQAKAGQHDAGFQLQYQ